MKNVEIVPINIQTYVALIGSIAQRRPITEGAVVKLTLSDLHELRNFAREGVMNGHNRSLVAQQTINSFKHDVGIVARLYADQTGTPLPTGAGGPTGNEQRQLGRVKGDDPRGN
jgi:phosphoribosylaminoimidazole-succinocarboxamide synthase